MNNYDFFENNDETQKSDIEAETQTGEVHLQDDMQRGITPKLFDRLKYLKLEKIYLIYALIGLLFVLGIYFIFGALFSDDNAAANTRSEVIPSALQDSKFVKVDRKQSVVNTQSVPKQVAVGIDAQELSAQLREIQANQENQNQRFEKTITQIAEQLKLLELNQAKTMQEIQNVLSKLGEAQNLDKSNQLMSLLNELQQQVKYLNAKEINMQDKLHLTAVVDGIAWLEDDKGKSMTVKEGSHLEGYGKVTKIDNKRYKIYMSSGFVFE